jgi:hypothetical protein
MGRPNVLHDGTGVINEAPGVGILDAYGTTVPDGDAGYAIGCLFRHIDGTDGTALYVNEGTLATANFNAVTVAAD